MHDLIETLAIVIELSSEEHIKLLFVDSKLWLYLC